ncbi:DUF4347 domain-containing protein [Desulforegula conservatrix]|uniref:DUF4347 domain-containing protein n=1 Tax=Desulforegula conservatrix TaxID=153026 RepID=UPI00041BCFD4|nr:DUF4347 domain-containing protein [Desulforegula conservatrix]
MGLFRKSSRNKNNHQKSISAGRRTGSMIMALEPRILYDAAAPAVLIDAFSAMSGAESFHGSPQPLFHIESDAANLDSSSRAATAFSQKTEIVFVDSSVPDLNTLVSGISANAEVVVLDPGKDGIAQISSVLSQRHNLDSVHLISHGSEGSAMLGSSSLNSNALEARSSEVGSWGSSLKQGGDILVYGCGTGHGEAGRGFVEKLSVVTGRDVAASDDATGHESKGGDWDLEVRTGTIEASVVVGSHARNSYTNIFQAIVVDTRTDVVNANDGVTSLREALATASNSDENVTINFSSDAFTYSSHTIVLSGSALNVSGKAGVVITIDGSLAGDVEIDGNNNSGVFNINSGTHAVLKQLSVINGSAQNGGGVANQGTLEILDGSFENCHSETGAGRGGAVFNSGTVSIDRSFFASNSSLNEGGAIYNSGEASIARSGINDSSSGSGAGIFNTQGATLSVSKTNIESNTATLNGGGIFNDGTLTLTDSDIYENSSNNNGAGIYNTEYAYADIASSEIYSNSAGNNGGGIFNSGVVSTKYTIIKFNDALKSGGGICNESYPVNLTLSLDRSTVYMNRSWSGAGISNFSGRADILNSTISGNKAGWIGNGTPPQNDPLGGKGGGILNVDGVLDISHSTIGFNTAESGGQTVHSVVESDYARTGFGHTIVSGSVSGPISSNGYNLFTQSIVEGSIGNDLKGADAGLMDITASENTSFYHKLDRTSQAIDAGDPTFVAGVSGVPLLDQAGNNRVTGGRIDIGAYESSYPPVTILAKTDSFSISEKSGIEISTSQLLSNDIGANVSIVSVASTSTSGGKVLYNAQTGSVSYDPSGVVGLLAAGSGETIKDSFEYTIKNANGETSTGKVSININGIDNIISVSTTSDTVANDGKISLREALNFAGTQSGKDYTITFDSAVFNGSANTIVLGGQRINISNMSGTKLTIDGDLNNDGHADVVINADSRSSAFVISSGSNVQIDGLVIKDGYSSSNGGGLYNSGTLEIKNSELLSNSSGNYGGAIYNESHGTLDIKNSVIDSNSAKNGGAIANDGRMQASALTLSENTAKFGGGIYTGSDSVNEIRGVTLNSNEATASGGGIYSKGDAIIASSTFNLNKAGNNDSYTGSGGGLYASGDSTEINGCTFTGNVAGDSGGAIDSKSLSLVVSGTNISDGSAFAGGGISVSGGNAVIKESQIIGNIATTGAGIMNSEGSVTLDSTSVSGNTASYNHEAAEYLSEIYNGSGGGIFNLDGNFTMDKSTISDNRAFLGAGAMNYTAYMPEDGTNYEMKIISSTISGNATVSIPDTAPQPEPSAIFLKGGGILNVSGTVDLKHSTVAFNDGNNGNSITNYAGPEYDAGQIKTGHTILSGNVVGVLNSSGYNLFTQAEVAGSVSTDLMNANPVLQPLSFNGGLTKTHLLGSGSQAINAGNASYVSGQNGVPLTAQRSENRVIDGRIDIGSVEMKPDVAATGNIDFVGAKENTALEISTSKLLSNDYGNGLMITNLDSQSALGFSLNLSQDGKIHYNQASAPLPQNIIRGEIFTDTFSYSIMDHNGATSTAVVTVVYNGSGNMFVVNTNQDSVASDGKISLREALNFTNQSQVNENYTITFDSSVFSGSSNKITLNGNELLISGPLGTTLTIAADINNDNAPDVIIDAQNASRALEIVSFSGADIQGLVIQNGSASDGGGICNRGFLSISNSEIRNCNAVSAGAAIVNYGNIQLDNVSIHNNSTEYGGGIFNTGTSFSIKNSYIFDNIAQKSGAGLFNCTKALVNSSEIYDNIASEFGGGICNTGTSILSITNSDIHGNRASIGGAGLSSDGKTVIESSEIYQNSGSTFGGGILIIKDISIKDSVINDNSSSNGAGILCSTEQAYFNSIKVQGNTASTTGGGIYNQGTLLIDQSEILENSANEWGGGVCNGANDTLTIKDSSIEQNSSSIGGGGVSSDGSLTLDNVFISGNSATLYGGGVFTNKPAMIRDSLISQNTSETGGGIVVAGDTIIDSSLIEKNRATQGGAGVFNAIGTTIVKDTMVSNNISLGSGGGVANALNGKITIDRSCINGNLAYTGAGLTNAGTELRIISSTVSGNEAKWAGEGSPTPSDLGLKAGGILNMSGSVIMSHSTIAMNTASQGDAVYSVVNADGTSAHTELGHTIVSGENFGPVTSLGYNLFTQASVTGSVATDLVAANPDLRPLSYGAGLTMSHSLGPVSQAINTGNPSAVSGQGGIPLTDQTGLERVQGGFIDIGSVESAPVSRVADKSAPLFVGGFSSQLRSVSGSFESGRKSILDTVGSLFHN